MNYTEAARAYAFDKYIEESKKQIAIYGKRRLQAQFESNRKHWENCIIDQQFAIGLLNEYAQEFTNQNPVTLREEIEAARKLGEEERIYDIRQLIIEAAKSGENSLVVNDLCDAQKEYLQANDIPFKSVSSNGEYLIYIPSFREPLNPQP